MDILIGIGIMLGVTGTFIAIGFIIWLLDEISKCPKIWWLEFYYSLKYVCYEIKDFIYQNPKANKTTNPQNGFITGTVSNHDIILSQLNQAINTEYQSNQSRYKMKNSKPRFISNSGIYKVKDGYNNPTNSQNNAEDKSNFNEFPSSHDPNSSIGEKGDSTKRV